MQQAVMFLGTCRAYDVARLLGRRGTSVTMPRHRFLSPRHILQFVQHLRGLPRHYDTSNVHLLSDEALNAIEDGVTRESLVEELKSYAEAWRTACGFVVEVPAIKEFAANVGGKPFVCAKTVQNRVHDLQIEAYYPSDGEVVRTLVELRKCLGNRPVVWLAYAAPEGGEPHIVKNRDRIAGLLTKVAGRFNDGFVDPQPTMLEIGQSAFFKDWRRNLDHYTAIGLHHVAVQVQEHIRSPIETFLPTDSRPIPA